MGQSNKSVTENKKIQASLGERSLGEESRKEKRERLRDETIQLRTQLWNETNEKSKQGLRKQLDEAKKELVLNRETVKDPLRAKLFEGKVSEQMKILEQKLPKSVDKEALLKKLTDKLHSNVDNLVDAAVLKYLQEQNEGENYDFRNGKLKGSYSEAMQQVTQNDGEALFEKFPGLRAMIDLETDYFVNNISEVLDELQTDGEQLSQQYFKCKKITGLKNLTVTNSDPHNAGRRVTILTLVDVDGNEHKVVNKPRDVRVDAKFIGKTGKTGKDASL